jgi:type IV secretion system protein VirB1
MVTLRRAVLGLLLALPTLLLAALPPELVPYFAGIRARESAGYPWSIYDNTTAKSYRLPNRAAAEQLAKDLVARGHNLDLGLFQINWHWQQKRPSLTLDNVFDPAMNESVAETILGEFYVAARSVYSNAADAIRMAVGAYNNGKVRVHNPKYVNAVYQLAGQPQPYADAGDPGSLVARTPLPGTPHGTEDWGVGAELARWFTGAPSLAILLDDARADSPADVDAASSTALLAALAAVAAVAVLLLLGGALLLVSIKLVPLAVGAVGLSAKRVALAAALRLHRRISSETARLARLP